MVGRAVPCPPYYITQRRREKESTLQDKRLLLLARESLRTRSGFLLEKPASRSKLCSLRQNHKRLLLAAFSSPLRLCVRYKIPPKSVTIRENPWIKNRRHPKVAPTPEPKMEQPERRPPVAPARNGHTALSAALSIPFQSSFSLKFIVVPFMLLDVQ